MRIECTLECECNLWDVKAQSKNIVSPGIILVALLKCLQNLTADVLCPHCCLALLCCVLSV